MYHNFEYLLMITKGLFIQSRNDNLRLGLRSGAKGRETEAGDLWLYLFECALSQWKKSVANVLASVTVVKRCFYFAQNKYFCTDSSR
jgi:hypothetical protein